MSKKNIQTVVAPVFFIGSSQIRCVDGLYSLNDLHKASGRAAKHRPSYFLSNDQTRALIKVIKTAGIPAVKSTEGRNGGTYACKELVIAYAAWISPAFHLQVIRVFLDSAKTPGMNTLPAVRSLTREEQTAINMRAHVLAQEKYREIRNELMSDYLAGRVDRLDEWAPQQSKPMHDLDMAGLMLEGLPDMTVDIPNELSLDIEKKAWEMSRECYCLCIEYLRRVIAYRCIGGNGLNLPYSEEIVRKATLGNALVHQISREKERIEELLEFVKLKTDKALTKIQESRS